MFRNVLFLVLSVRLESGGKYHKYTTGSNGQKRAEQSPFEVVDISEVFHAYKLITNALISRRFIHSFPRVLLFESCLIPVRKSSGSGHWCKNLIYPEYHYRYVIRVYRYTALFLVQRIEKKLLSVDCRSRSIKRSS
jgi:hypothetical protein